MESLPLETLLHIASHNRHVWSGMLVVRSFGEYTMTKNCRNYVLRVFCQTSIVPVEKCIERRTYLGGSLHSFFDQPAEIYQDGEIKKWYRHGKCHRGGDLPAVIHCKVQCWKQYGYFHRDGDLPAIIHPLGLKEWYQYGKRHRDGGSPAVTHPNGMMRWYVKGKPHRDEDLPAIITSSGSKQWYRDGEIIQRSE